jgi:hypothetical protein
MINISKRQKFGVEIEFYGALRRDIEYILERNGLKAKGWIVKPEETIDCDFGSDYIGEINSPILTSTKEDLEDLKKMLEILQYQEARSNQRCGSHIHFDAERFTWDNVRSLQNLVLLYMCYEDVIFKYSSGRFPNIRKGAEQYAKPLMNTVKMQDVKTFFYDEISYEDLCYLYIEKTHKDVSLNLLNLRGNGLNTIEFRSPDGTLDYSIWLNNINTFGLMLDYATKMPYEVREYLYKEIKRKKQIGFDPEFTNLDKANEFINLITFREEDKNNFIKQYKKEF